MKIDHVLIAAADLDEAAARLQRRGLASVPGGRHPGWGTANRIVPLGPSYLELVTVVDAAEAAQSPFGRWVAGAGDGSILGWAVRTTRLDDVARRLGLQVTPGSRATPDGRVLRWRTAGVAEAAAQPPVPFFIEWDADTPFPGDAAARHGVAPNGIVRLEVQGDVQRLTAWLGAGHDLPVVFAAGRRGAEDDDRGRPGVRLVVVGTERGPLVIATAPGAA